MLPQQSTTALPCTRKITKNRQRELFEWGGSRSDFHQVWNDPSLGSLFLSTLVQATQIETRLEDVVRNFLAVPYINVCTPLKILVTYGAVLPSALFI